MTVNLYVEFLPKNEISLQRTIEVFKIIKSTKTAIESEDVLLDEDNMPIAEIYDLPIINYLNDIEKAYFSNLSSEEHDEWIHEWFSTPIAIRHSSQMICPQWDLGSMLDIFWNGEYDLIAIQEEKRIVNITSRSIHIPTHMEELIAWWLFLNALVTRSLVGKTELAM